MSRIFCLLLGCSSEKAPDTAEPQRQIVVAAAGPDQVVEEQALIHFDGSESSGARFEWDFGDGSTAEEMITEHRYRTPGRYRAILTAWGSDGTRKSDAAQVVVYGTPTQQPAIVTASMIRDAEELWVVYPEAGALISINSRSQLSTTTEICHSPQQIAMGSIGGTKALGITCFATESSTAQIQFIDPTDPNTVIDTIALEHNPFGIVSREEQWWITLENGELISVSNAQITNRVDTGWSNDLRSITLLDDDRVVVPRWRSVETGLIHTYSSNLELLSSTQLPVDERGDSDNTTGGVPNLLHEVRPSPDGRRWWVPMMHANIQRGEWRNGEPLTHESTVRAVLGEMLPEAAVLADVDRKQFDERGRSTVALPSPLGDRLAVLHPSAQHISVLDGSSLEHLGAIQGAGHMITAMVFDETGDRPFTWVWLDRRVDAYDVSVPNRINKLWSVDLSQDDPLTESQLRGKQIFHDSYDPRMSKANYIACSHCHPAGQHDRQTWDFSDRGEGLRNTTSLLGSGQTGMLHWSGNFDEFQDFEFDIRQHFGGQGLMEDSVLENATPLGDPLSGESEELDALAEWLSELEPPMSLVVNPLALETFNDVGCQECHSGPMYTDSSILTPIRHDIGTIEEHSGSRLAGELDGLDTPSLIGLRHSAPYLHDGSARTIEAAILAHDLISVQSLSSAQLELLVELMESL